MSLRRKLLLSLLHAGDSCLAILGERNRLYIQSAIHEYFMPIRNIDVAGRKIHFYCPSFITLWRAETMLTKDIDTIRWIDSFGANATFMDIGANVGIFSLYAAVKRQSRVYAFEPDAGNYYVLNRNIEINKFHPLISAYCIALSNSNLFEHLQMEDTIAGSALKKFGSRMDMMNSGGIQKKNNYSQGCLGMTLDHIFSRYNLEVPNYIKIDVDGTESKIIEGSVETLRNPTLKSIVTELDTADPSSQDTIIQIQEAGFKLDKVSHGPGADNTEYEAMYNHFFSRP